MAQNSTIFLTETLLKVETGCEGKGESQSRRSSHPSAKTKLTVTVTLKPQSQLLFSELHATSRALGDRMPLGRDVARQLEVDSIQL